jgi:hypothetical protein
MIKRYTKNQRCQQLKFKGNIYMLGCECMNVTMHVVVVDHSRR